MRCLCQGASPSRAGRADGLGGVRRRAAQLVPYAGRFDGFHSMPASVSKTCLVRFDNNKYSVLASAVGRPVEIHAYADRILSARTAWSSASIRALRPQRDHLRSLALRAGAGPQAGRLAQRRARSRTGSCRRQWSGCAASSAGADDGDRQMVDILAAVLTDGLTAVEAACAEAIEHGVYSADVILNILARQPRSGPPVTILMPAALKLATRRSPTAPAMTASGGRTDGTHRKYCDLMGALKLFGMRAAFDEIMASAIKRQHEPRGSSAICCRPRYREAGALDQVPAHHRQASAGQGSRGLRLCRHAGQREPGPRPRRRRLRRRSAQCRPGRRHRHRQVPSGHRHRPPFIRAGARGRFFNVVDLVNRLEAETRAAGRAASPITSPASTSSSSMNSAIFPSPSPAASCSSIWSAGSTNAPRHRHHQSRLRRMAERLRRRQDDHRAARPPHPSLRHRRDRQRFWRFKNRA